MCVCVVCNVCEVCGMCEVCVCVFVCVRCVMCVKSVLCEVCDMCFVKFRMILRPIFVCYIFVRNATRAKCMCEMSVKCAVGEASVLDWTVVVLIVITACTRFILASSSSLSRSHFLQLHVDVEQELESLKLEEQVLNRQRKGCFACNLLQVIREHLFILIVCVHACVASCSSCFHGNSRVCCFAVH